MLITFTLIRGRSRDGWYAVADGSATETGIAEDGILSLTEEHNKTRVQNLTDDEREWGAHHA